MTGLPQDIESLREQQREIRDRLRDTTDEKAFIIRQSGVHLSRSEWERYDREIESYEARLREIEARLAALRDP